MNSESILLAQWQREVQRANEQILVNITPQETRVAMLEDGIVQELHIERAASFIAHLDGSYSGVMGLPLCETARLLAMHGLDILGSHGHEQ